MTYLATGRMDTIQVAKVFERSGIVNEINPNDLLQNLTRAGLKILP